MKEADVFNEQYSKYYNLLYSDKDYAAEAGYVDGLLKKYAPGCKSILEYGSGTGGHGLLLNQKGYNVYGVERSEAMARVARERGLECKVADITSLELNKRFDVTLALFHVISYINPNNQLLQLFRDTKTRLHKNGLFIFDVWFTPAVLHQMPEKRVKKMEDQEIEVVRTAVPEIDHFRNVVDVNYHIILKNKASGAANEFNEKHSMRHFGVTEIDLLASQTGFVLIHSEEFMTGKAPSTATWGVTFILQANDE
jgi:SAM-dependent methyltransferase